MASKYQDNERKKAEELIKKEIRFFMGEKLEKIL